MGDEYLITKNKIIRIIIILVSMFLALILYSTEYSIKNNPEAIKEGISEFLERNIEVVKYEKVDNTIYVYFTDDSKATIGYTVLYRGLNWRYQIRQANLGSRNQVVYINEFKTLRNRYWAVFGTNYDNKIDSIIFDGAENTITLDGISDMDEILIVHESENELWGMSFVYKYTLLDARGDDISDDMRTYLVASESSGFGRGKAELFMLNIFCGVIILVGYWLSRMVKSKDSVDSFT